MSIEAPERAHALPQLAPHDESNRVLEENVRPPDWRNPAPARRYNMVVIGGGTAGLVTAAGAAGLGARVALIERALMGGDCLNVGCVPSKALIRCARAAAEVRAASEFGVRVAGDVTVDFGAVMERMRKLRARISVHDSARRFTELGVDVFLGDARFTGRDTIEVGGSTLRFARACVATGARPVAPSILGLREAGYLDNVTVFSLTEPPRRLVVLGAGPIGCELAQSFARFGSEVHLLEMSDRILVKEDPDASELLHERMSADGVRIHTRTQLERVERDGDVRRLHLSDGRALEVDRILVGVGRAPNVQEMGLEEAGIEYDERSGVRVDDRLRTTNPHVFAAGDVCSRFKFTHAADAMARIVIRNALFFGRAKASELVIPWCTYTDPEVAHVGMYAADAAERGIDVASFRVELGEVDRAVLDGDTDGFLRVLTETRSRRILGATLVARHAGEMISELTAAVGRGARLDALSGTIHPYPTQSEIVRKAADACARARLTPRRQRTLARLLAWRR
jgi:pyruvate/2-oxoglutarate dehydrogenase complex dihydrolipoamide dehydrogenase (E3) component